MFECIYIYSAHYLVQAIPGVVESIVVGMGGLTTDDLVADLGSVVLGLHQSVQALQQFML